MSDPTDREPWTSPDLPEDADRALSLCETLDRVLHKGVVVAGEVIISVADIDLIYLNLQVLLASVDTIYPERRRLLAAGSGGGS